MKREWLKAARKSKNLTLVKLAEQIGCSFTHISDIEQGRKNPSLKMAAKLAKALEIDVILFFDQEESA